MSKMQHQEQKQESMDHEKEGLAPPSRNGSVDGVWASPNPFGEANQVTERATSASDSDASVGGAASDTNTEQGNTAQQDVLQLARRKSMRTRKPSQKLDAAEQRRSPPTTPNTDSSSRFESRASGRTDKSAPSSEPSERPARQRRGPSSKANEERWTWEEEELILLEWAERRRHSTSWKKIGSVLGRSDQATRIRYCHLTKPPKKQRAKKALDMTEPKILPPKLLARLRTLQAEESANALQVHRPSAEHDTDGASEVDATFMQEDETSVAQLERATLRSPLSSHRDAMDLDMDDSSEVSSTANNGSPSTPRYATPYYGTQDTTIHSHFICRGCKYPRPTQRQRLAADDICTYCDKGISGRGRDTEELVVCVECGKMGFLGSFSIYNGLVTHPGHYHQDTCTECQRIRIETTIPDVRDGSGIGIGNGSVVVANMGLRRC